MLIIFIVSFALSLAVNWLVRSVARKNGWVSRPQPGRHIHLLPVPRLGGIGVFASFATTISGVAVFRSEWLPSAGFLHLLVPATVMFGVGLWDDLRPLSPKTKLTFQVACGCALFLWMRQTHIGHSITGLGFGATILLAGSVGWVVLVSNSMNLIDGIDGLAGGTAVLSLAAIGCVAWHSGQGQITLVAAILIASTLGFLRFNLNPATMFLGDGGSLFLGFMISVLGLSWTKSHSPHVTMTVAIVILSLPLAETAVSITRRFLSNRPMFDSDQEHIHHKLLALGFSQRKVARVLFGVATISGTAGIAMAIGGRNVFVISSSAVVVLVVAGVVALQYAEFAEISRILRRVGEQRRIVANNVVLRKIAGRIGKTTCLGTLGEELRVAFITLRFDGFELSFVPWFVAAVPCEQRASVARWGVTQKTRSFDSSCWTIGVDLRSEQYGSIGWLRLARALDKGPLLFDPNVIVTTLQPAIIKALEQCLSAHCYQDQAWIEIHPWTWSASAKLSARAATVSDSSHPAPL